MYVKGWNSICTIDWKGFNLVWKDILGRVSKGFDNGWNVLKIIMSTRGSMKDINWVNFWKTLPIRWFRVMQKQGGSTSDNNDSPSGDNNDYIKSIWEWRGYDPIGMRTRATRSVSVRINWWLSGWPERVLCTD